MQRNHIGVILAGLALVLAAGRPAAAQDPPPPPPVVDTTLLVPDSIAADTTGISPRTAMIRSWLVPGWGQASVGKPGRGGFFVAVQGASWYMLFKSWARLDQARAIEEARVAWASDSLNAIIFADPAGAGAELADPAAYDEAVAENELVAQARGLVDSRSQQRQDWITGTLFLTLISGVDAFVAAHLADAPVSLETAVTPDGAIRLGVRVPVDRRR